MHDNNLALFDKHVMPRLTAGSRVLEVGAGPHPSVFAAQARNLSLQWDTLDLFPSDCLTWVADDPDRFPVPDAHYDVVFSANVIEHVAAPWNWIHEVVRVCRPGGMVITMNPVNWGYHAYPLDCWRIYPDGMRALYAHANLDMLFCTCENAEGQWNRFVRRGWKVAVKHLIRRETGGEPLVPLDTIAVGIKQ